MVRGDASEASRISVSPTKLVGPMQKRPLLTAFVTMAAALFVSGAARAESDTVEVRGAVESGAALPSTSDKPAPRGPRADDAAPPPGPARASCSASRRAR
ncbi:MAG: hypothetical protein U0235_21750 [Polyangiaceae bacterium]